MKDELGIDPSRYLGDVGADKLTPKFIEDELGMAWHDASRGKGYFYDPDYHWQKGNPKRLEADQIRRRMKTAYHRNQRRIREGSAHFENILSGVQANMARNGIDPSSITEEEIAQIEKEAFQRAEEVIQDPTLPSMSQQMAEQGLIYNSVRGWHPVTQDGDFPTPEEIGYAKASLNNWEKRENAFFTNNTAEIEKYEADVPQTNIFDPGQGQGVGGIASNPLEAFYYDNQGRQAAVVDYENSARRLGLDKGQFGGKKLNMWGFDTWGAAHEEFKIGNDQVPLEEQLQAAVDVADHHLYKGDITRYEKFLDEADNLAQEWNNQGGDLSIAPLQRLSVAKRELPKLKRDVAAKIYGAHLNKVNPEYKVDEDYLRPPRPPEDIYPEEAMRWDAAKYGEVAYIWDSNAHGEVPQPIKEKWAEFTGVSQDKYGDPVYEGARRPEHQAAFERQEAKRLEREAELAEKNQHLEDPAERLFVEYFQEKDPVKRRRIMVDLQEAQKARAEGKSDYDLASMADEETVAEWDDAQEKARREHNQRYLQLVQEQGVLEANKQLGSYDGYDQLDEPPEVTAARERMQERKQSYESLAGLRERSMKMFEEEKQEKQDLEDRLLLNATANGQVGDRKVDNRIRETAEQYTQKARDLRIRAQQFAAQGDFKRAGELMARKDALSAYVDRGLESGSMGIGEMMDVADIASNEARWAVEGNVLAHDPEIAEVYNAGAEKHETEFQAFHGDPKQRRKGRKKMIAGAKKKRKDAEAAAAGQQPPNPDQDIAAANETSTAPEEPAPTGTPEAQPVATEVASTADAAATPQDLQEQQPPPASPEAQPQQPAQESQEAQGPQMAQVEVSMPIDPSHQNAEQQTNNPMGTAVHTMPQSQVASFTQQAEANGMQVKSLLPDRFRGNAETSSATDPGSGSPGTQPAIDSSAQTGQQGAAPAPPAQAPGAAPTPQPGSVSQVESLSPNPNAQVAQADGGPPNSLAPSNEAQAGIGKPNMPPVGINKAPGVGGPRIPGNNHQFAGVGVNRVTPAGQKPGEVARFTVGNDTNTLNTNLFGKPGLGVKAASVQKDAGWLKDIFWQPVVDSGQGFKDFAYYAGAGRWGDAMKGLAGGVGNAALTASWFIPGGQLVGGLAKGGLTAARLASGARALGTAKGIGRLGRSAVLSPAGASFTGGMALNKAFNPNTNEAHRLARLTDPAPGKSRNTSVTGVSPFKWLKNGPGSSAPKPGAPAAPKPEVPSLKTPGK